MKGVSRQPILPYVVGAIGLVFMVGVSEYAAKYLTNLFGPRAPQATEVGRVADSRGRVTRVRGARRDVRDERPLNLLDGDRLETGTDAEATVVLTSQDELILAAKTTLAFELWNEHDANSPIYIHVVTGDVTSKRSGVRGRAFVVRDGRLYLPGQKPGAKQSPLLITRVPGEPTGATLTPEDTVETPPKDALESPVAPRTDEPETLANEYVEEMISSRSTQLQKCWLSRLKDKPNLKGKLTVQFEITRRGKVRDASIVDSSLNDAQLGQCVATAIERIPFRTFKGPEISIAYPITFE